MNDTEKQKRIAEICKEDHKILNDYTEGIISKEESDRKRNKLVKEWSKLRNEKKMLREMIQACTE
jgi:hypothetical protein